MEIISTLEYSLYQKINCKEINWKLHWTARSKIAFYGLNMECAFFGHESHAVMKQWSLYLNKSPSRSKLWKITDATLICCVIFTHDRFQLKRRVRSISINLIYVLCACLPRQQTHEYYLRAKWLKMVSFSSEPGLWWFEFVVTILKLIFRCAKVYKCDILPHQSVGSQ